MTYSNGDGGQSIATDNPDAAQTPPILGQPRLPRQTI